MPIAPGAPVPDVPVFPVVDLEADEAAAPAGDPEEIALPALAASGPALLFFFKGDCGACDAAAHVLPRAAGIPGLTVAAVSQDDDFLTQVFARNHGLVDPVRVLVDPEPWGASEALGLAATPTWVLLARGGRVDAVFEGWSRDHVNALAARAAALAGALAGAVSTPADGPAYRPG